MKDAALEHSHNNNKKKSGVAALTTRPDFKVQMKAFQMWTASQRGFAQYSKCSVSPLRETQKSQSGRSDRPTSGTGLRGFRQAWI